MARHESEREDLMAEATALVRRIELLIPGEADSVICGFHADSRLSIYFGSDPVFHFDSQWRLRRAFVDGVLFRTQATTLAQLRRIRTHTSTVLERRDLRPEELASFLDRARGCLGALDAALMLGTARSLRQVPATDRGLLADLRCVVSKLASETIALAPAISGKR